MKVIKQIINKIVNFLPFVRSIIETQGSSAKRFLIGMLSILILFLLCISAIFILVTLLLRLKNYLKAQKWSNFEEKWHDDLLDILAGDKSPDVLMKKVGEDQKLYFLDYLFKFALRIKGQELNILSDIAKNYHSTLIKRLDKGDTTQKIRAIITLDKLEIKNLEDKYLQLLHDKSPMVSLYAARVLIRQAESNLEEYLKQIIQILPRYEDWSYRLISQILTRAGSEQAGFFREKFLDQETNPKTRVIIGQTLINLKDVRAADSAEQVLRKNPSRQLTLTCLEIISKIGLPKHREIVRQLARSSDPGIKAQAIEALGTIGEKEDIETIKKEFIDQSNWVAMHSARALKDMKAEETLEELSQLDNYKANMALQVLN